MHVFRLSQLSFLPLVPQKGLDRSFPESDLFPLRIMGPIYVIGIKAKSLAQIGQFYSSRVIRLAAHVMQWQLKLLQGQTIERGFEMTTCAR